MLRGSDYYSAHELFELTFRQREGTTRDLFRALAQLAAAYHQLSLGRARASVRTWNKARHRLEALGALDRNFAEALDAVYRDLGLTADGPRFCDPRVLDGVTLPVPDESAL